MNPDDITKAWWLATIVPLVALIVMAFWIGMGVQIARDGRPVQFGWKGYAFVMLIALVGGCVSSVALARGDGSEYVNVPGLAVSIFFELLAIGRLIVKYG